MFGRQKKEQKKNEEQKDLPAQVQTIPDIFYGGQDPMIYHANDQKEAASGENAAKPAQGGSALGGKKIEIKKEETKQLASSGKTPTPPASKRKKIYIILGISLFLIISIAGISWYYVRQAKEALYGDSAAKNAKSAAPIAVSSPPPVVPAPPLEIPPVEATSTPILEEKEPEQPDEIIADLVFPKSFLLDSEDLDADQLTDEEEAFFGTDSGVWDTDHDGYFDGQEVINLYNPIGFAPVRIIDSGAVTEYKNPMIGYRLYYPNDWVIGVVDKKATQVLVSAITGEYVEIRTIKKTQKILFPLWFAENAKGEKFQDVIPFSNRFDEKGWKRNDGLVAYYDTEGAVYVLVYHQGTEDRVRYRHIMDMIIQSFRPQAIAPFLPDQPILPTPPDAESTPIEETPSPAPTSSASFSFTTSTSP